MALALTVAKLVARQMNCPVYAAIAAEPIEAKRTAEESLCMLPTVAIIPSYESQRRILADRSFAC